MPKISALPDLTTAAAGDEIPVNDVSLTETRKMTLTKLKEWLQSLVAWVQPSNLVSDAIGFGYQEIARTTLVAAADVITVSSIPPYKYLIFLLYGNAGGGTVDTNFKFNNDGGSNYMSTHNVSYGAAVANGNTTSVASESGATDSGGINTGRIEVIANITAEEKNFLYGFISQDAAGATIPTYLNGFGKWMNTSAQINRIDWNNSGTGDFAIGSEIVVLGKN